MQAAGLPERIRLRFVTVRLNTGELEVLATNLLEEQLYPTECFGELYPHPRNHLPPGSPVARAAGRGITFSIC